MTMHGSLSIGRKSIRWSRRDADHYLMALAMGVFAGMAVTYMRMPLQMPGHKAVLWMAPAVACRLAMGKRGAATASVMGTIVSVLVLGGQLAGSAMMMPLVAAAGVVLDAACGLVEKHARTMGAAMAVLAMAGMAGNLICFIKRLFEPVGQMFSVGNMESILSAAASYAVFGLAAGVCGGMAGWGMRTKRLRVRGAEG